MDTKALIETAAKAALEATNEGRLKWKPVPQKRLMAQAAAGNIYVSCQPEAKGGRTRIALDGTDGEWAVGDFEKHEPLAGLYQAAADALDDSWALAMKAEFEITIAGLQTEPPLEHAVVTGDGTTIVVGKEL